MLYLYKQLIYDITYYAVAEFALNMDAFSIEEDQGPQVVFAQIVNGVILDTSIDVVVWTLQSVPPSAIG